MHFETELQLFWGGEDNTLIYYKISVETAFEAVPLLYCIYCTTVHRYFFFKNKNEYTVNTLFVTCLFNLNVLTFYC